jgi:hypothetical protein
MDPNETLRELRRILRAGAWDAADAERVRELIEALDAWLSRGGFLPDAWTSHVR